MDAHTEYIGDIVSRLKMLDPYKIILFGSQAFRTYTETSDIDLLIVLDSDVIPQTYEEKTYGKKSNNGH